MRWSFGLATAFICSSVIPSHPSAAALQQQANCREFTSTVTIDGRDQQLVGQVCQQPDGSWRIVQEGGPAAEDLPAQRYAYPYPYPYPYPYYWTDWWGPPFFGSVFFVDRFGRSHRFHHDGFHRFDHGEFRHGGFHHSGAGFHGGAHGGGAMMGGRGGGHR
jgi:surface antigen